MSNYIAMDDSFRIYPIRGYHGAFHLLHDGSRRKAVLIDAGLVGEIPRLQEVLREIGLGWPDIEAILLTHGHLDHTGNLARLKELTAAPVLAHPAEQGHIDGTFPYAGPSRLCGLLEATGRRLFRYRAVRIDQPVAPGEELPYWGGLRVIHLPGHTEGHCGFLRLTLQSPVFGRSLRQLLVQHSSPATVPQQLPGEICNQPEAG